MKITDFYGTADQQYAPEQPALEVPAEQRSIGGKPAFFWLGLIALLIGARVVYELAGNE